MIFDGLLDESGLLGPGVDPALVVQRHLAPEPNRGRLVVPDTAVAATARLVPVGRTVSASVLISGGAGGLVALADRTPPPELTVAAAESALRDLDDLAGNAARVVAAARQLPDDVVVFVELPGPADPGWQRAVAVVEAAGLNAKLSATGSDLDLATRLSALVEADLPFKLTGLDLDRLPAVLTLVDALIEGAEPAEAAELAGAPVAVAEIADWDELRAARVRRRLVSCDGVDPGSWLDRVLGRRG